MIVAVADTHGALWYVFDDPRLSRAAQEVFAQAIASGDQVGISSVTFAELVYLIEKQRIAPDALSRLAGIVRDPARELIEIPFTISTAEAMRRISRRSVPDMPDRMIAATALHLGVPLISRDANIRASGITTIW